VEDPESTHLRNLKKVTHTIQFLLQIQMKDEDCCFDYDRWCCAYARGYASAYTPGTEAHAKAWVYASSVCEAAAGAYASSIACFLAQGKIQVTRNGNYGSVTEVDLVALMDQATVTRASAGANADASGSAGVKVKTATSLAEYCQYLSNDKSWEYWYYTYCTSNAAAQALVKASAGAVGSGFADASIAGNAQVGGRVNVQGSNLLQFNTTVGGFAKSFTVADAVASADAWAKAFAKVKTKAYQEYCYAVITENCPTECTQSYRYWAECEEYLCNPAICETTSWDYDSAYEKAFAEACAAAQATAVIDATYNFVVSAYFKRTQGITNTNNGGDIILLGGNTDAKVHFDVSCGANAYSYAGAYP
jgi:hypothetical protein